jgi:hypothetical protein
LPNLSTEKQMSCNSGRTAHRRRYAVAARIVIRVKGPFGSAMPVLPGRSERGGSQATGRIDNTRRARLPAQDRESRRRSGWADHRQHTLDVQLARHHSAPGRSSARWLPGSRPVGHDKHSSHACEESECRSVILPIQTLDDSRFNPVVADCDLRPQADVGLWLELRG